MAEGNAGPSTAPVAIGPRQASLRMTPLDEWTEMRGVFGTGGRVLCFGAVNAHISKSRYGAPGFSTKGLC